MADTNAINAKFPSLRAIGFAVTSSDSADYNCIAWAAEDTTQWWWPINGYWPPGLERRRTVECFTTAFMTLGYDLCANHDLEAGYEKVAIYVDRLDRPTHMARQLASGWWSSKLGSEEDVIHKTLGGIEGPDYGRAVRMLRRPKAGT